jgi:hypothetical protein
MTPAVSYDVLTRDFLQGLAEVIRAVRALRSGVWPERHSDVEETETRLARASQM